MKQRLHFSPSYLMNPQHPITIDVIGCGGTGTKVLTCLAQMHTSLLELEHPGLFVRVFDPDVVTEANIGRQPFSYDDIGRSKAVVYVSRINRFVGTAWEAIPEYFDTTHEPWNIVITCVDNVKTRLELSDRYKDIKKLTYIDYTTPLYWLDYGNSQHSGQVVLGSVYEFEQPESDRYEAVSRLPFITDRHDLTTVNEADSGPSCSLAEALDKQDLFINASLAQPGCNLLWRMIKDGMTPYCGFYFDLARYNMNGLPV